MLTFLSSDPCRSSERDSAFLTPTLTKEATCLSTPLLPILFSTPAPPPAAAASRSSYGTHAGDSASHSGVSIRKRRRLAASPGGLHWTSSGNNSQCVCVCEKLLPAWSKHAPLNVYMDTDSEIRSKVRSDSSDFLRGH